MVAHMQSLPGHSATSSLRAIFFFSLVVALYCTLGSRVRSLLLLLLDC